MSRIVGIDLGTTNSLVATVDSGIPLVIADAVGRRLTPSVVYFPDCPGNDERSALRGPPEAEREKATELAQRLSPSGSPLSRPFSPVGEKVADQVEPVVGEKANRVRVVKPEQTVYSIKRFMGRRGNEISREEMLVTYPVRGEGAGAVTVEINGRRYSPEEISAEVLKKLRRDAEAYFNEPVTRAVITVPAYFNDAQRNATKKAGELAGFTVERILNEPTAAALAYGLDKLKEHARIAVYDLGGGTFDLSILELNGGVFQVLATHGDTRLGGDDLDKRLIDFLAGKIEAAGGPDATRDLPMLSRVREAAEKAKIKLSAETKVEVALPFLTPQFSFSQELTREELEDLTRDIIARTRPHCLRALADAKLEPTDLDQVILAGGQTRMPLVRRMAAEIFGCGEFEEARGGIRLGTDHHRAAGPLLNTSQNPDEVVALGAGIQAEILSGGFRNVLLLDVTPLSLGLETFGGLMNVIIHRNSTIPVKAGEMFTTAVDNQKNMLIHVLQGERERAKDNWSLGKFAIDFEPAPRGVPRIGVQFEIDANGILRVLARDTGTGRQTEVELKSAVDVEDADVQRMVEESVEHAFEDLASRRWTEAALGARNVLGATHKGLADCGGELVRNQREQIDAAMMAVEAALGTVEPTSGIGDVQKLKNATDALDAATRPLAELMMDKAMEGWLRKKGLIG